MWCKWGFFFFFNSDDEIDDENGDKELANKSEREDEDWKVCEADAFKYAFLIPNKKVGKKFFNSSKYKRMSIGRE